MAPPRGGAPGGGGWGPCAPPGRGAAVYKHKMFFFPPRGGAPRAPPLLLSPVGVGLDHFRSTVYLSMSSWLISTPRPGFWGTAM